jgi:phthiocerol/phenolphthiocerol synthesis type-I polyketide synthase E
LARDLADAVAIVGMAGKFPGARDLDAFWQNLRAGVDSVRRLDRAELAALGVPAAVAEDPAFVPAVALPPGIEELDAPFFGISHREAELMDPQHRLFLECAWEALESAGYAPETFGGDVAVFGGTSTSTYLVFNIAGNPRLAGVADPLQLIVGNAVDSLTTRVSFKLDLRGPSHAVQCACSTALVAVHQACDSLLAQQCDLALAGAVSINVAQRAGYFWQPDSILSSDGRCRAFDAAAGGTVFGGGVGMVALRRLDDALAAGDPVRAVIRGSAVNNDGAAKAGYSAPSVEGEARAIAEALAVACVDADSIGYLEAHGTGTALGDPVEVRALHRVFRAATARRGFCALGTVKSNIGHLDVAAGIAGLIKAVLVLEHREIPPSVHFERPNPRIDFAEGPFYVNRELAPWPAGEAPRRAGVSAFGFGGTNAHLVLEEAPARRRPGPAGVERTGSRPARLLLLSARTAPALAQAAQRLAAHLRRVPEVDLGDVAWTLAAGRRVFAHRRMLVCATAAEAAAALDGAATAAAVPPDATAVDPAAPRRRAIAFLFPGQGAQHPGMARELYRAEPVFRAELDRCAELLVPHLGLDLRQVLYPEAARPALATDGGEEAAQPPAAGGGEEAARLAETSLAQPALFAVEYALAQLWRSWGVEPQAMMGHSVGEYVAACLAEVLSLRDALALVAARGRAIAALPAGAMLAVALSEDEIAARLAAPGLPAGLALAAINGERRVVVAGPPDAVAALARRLAGEGVEARPLHTSHAFHSPAMAAAAAPFRQALARIRLAAPVIRFISNVTGTWIEPAEATSHDYWVRHLLAPVRFAAGLARLAADPDRVLLEVGPGHTLTTLARQSAGRPALSSLPHPRDPGSDYQHLLGTAGHLWLAGQRLDAEAVYRGQGRMRLALPTYPFERQRYWIEPPSSAAAYGVLAAGAGAGTADAATARTAASTGPGAADAGPGGEDARAGAADAGPGGEDARAGAADAGLGAVAEPTAAARPSSPGVGERRPDGGLALHPRPPLPNAFVALDGELEERVAAVWREVLGVAEVGRHDSFLDLGGDSLLATRLMARLRQELAVELPIERLFEKPTVAAVAAAALAATAARADRGELARMLAEIEGLSAEDLETELAASGNAESEGAPGARHG